MAEEKKAAKKAGAKKASSGKKAAPAKKAAGAKKAPSAKKAASSAKRTGGGRQPSHEQIAERAYDIYERGQGGDHVEHWLQAERELNEEG